MGGSTMQIRTISGAVRQLQKDDPDTAVTAAYIRRLVLAGKIPYTRSGNRVLLNMDALRNYLELATYCQTSNIPTKQQTAARIASEK